MEKIDFVNYTTPALNATNLNKLQQNVEDDIGDLTQLETSAKNNLVEAINEAANTGGNINVYNEYTASATDTYSCNYVNGLSGKILWTNSNPTSSFPSQTITLSSGDYDFYEVFFAYGTQTMQYVNGFKSIKGKGLIGGMMGFGSGTLLRRKVDYIDETHLLFSNSINGTTEGDGYMIPIYVIGYKTNIFD